MSLANHRAQVSELLDDWAENQKQAKNISKVDAEILAAIAKATGATHE